MLHFKAIVLLILTCSIFGQQLQFLGPEPHRSYVSHSASAGSHVYQLTAISSSQGTVNYSIAQTDPSNPALFAVDANTGVITNTATYSGSPNQYNLVVEASLTGTPSVTANLTINVLPSYETAPQFEHSNIIVTIVEDSPVNTPVTVAQAFSLTSTNTRQYTLVSGNTNGDFNIGVTGIITTTNSLDRETVSQYNIIVRYIDDVGSADTNIQILIQDLNDNIPTFNTSLYQFSINETPLYNTLIGTVSATDPDDGTNAFITYSLVGQHASQFIITNDGKILTQTILDYEELSQYTLEVRARDAGSPILSSTAAILIYVNNQDDECPVFSGSLYIKDLPFDLLNPPLIDDYVLTVEANDPDNAGLVYYTLISGNNGTVFSLDSISGNITLARNDEGIRNQYTLIISASDANCINKSLARVEIGIGSANEYSPVLTMSSCTALLAENPVNGTIVTTLLATDPDIGVNGKVRYDIVANIGDFMLFAVDSESGIVTTTASSSSYDRESRAGFQVGVTATDGGFRQDFCILSIELVDVNDNRPTFDLPDYSTNIDNNPVLGSYIIQVQAQDPDFGNNGNVSYSLVTGNDCPFIIDSITGTILVNSSVINPNHCSLTVNATDHGSPPLSGIATINITILHQGDIPLFNQSVYSVTIAENHGTSVAFITVKATVSGQGSIVYTMDMGSEYRTNNEGNFDVFDISGGIYIVSNKPIDYEKLYPGPYLFRLLVRATSSNIFSVAVVTVNVTDVNDNFPVFPDVDGQPNTHPSVTFTVVEGQPPGPIGIVQASDNDTGFNGIIYYELNTITNLFAVSNNGTISSRIGGFDAENISSYNFLVGAYNPGHKDKESVIDVNIIIEDINDNAPFFKESSYIVPLNETHLVHDMILKLVATDPDKNDQNNLVFAILSGNDEATFQIESSAGNGLLYLKRQLDYETQTQYVLVIEVSDGVYTDTTTVSVQVFNVDDEPPVFSQSIYHATIIENTPLGTTVLQIEATDKDSIVIKFELKGLAEGRFLIDANGVITVNGTIDREEFLPGEQIVFLVFAYGGSLSTADIVVNVSDINDFVPKFLFSPFFGTAPENTDPGLNGLYIVQVKAVDFDKGSNGTIRYSLVSGETDGFQIDPFTGVIIANRTFDREMTRLFTLIAKAEDKGQPHQLFSTVEVVVEITDSNDNPPYWIYPYMYARVYENSPIGKVVIQLPASDPDNGINATIFFALTSGNAQGKFNLTSSTGEVTVARSLDYENIGERRYLLYFSIWDAGSPSLRSAEIGELEIHILDGNDHSPQFFTPVVNFEVAENTLVGSIVHTLTATDEDTGSNSAINYTIINGNSDGIFTLLSHNNGSVSIVISASLDYETTPNYSLSIMAFDGGYPSLSAQVTINITITDVNDESPLFTMNQYTVSIQEEMTPPITLIKTEADDPDSDNIPGGMVAQYELISSDDNKQQFHYDNDGWLSAIKRLDREEQAQYTFIVRAIDNDPVSPLTSTAIIVVTVLDINDNPSVDGGHLDILIQSQNAIFPPQELGQVYFVDPDQNDTFQDCSIISGDEHVISVHTNCTLYLAITIPQNTMYSVTIQGRDGIHDYVNTMVSLLLQNITNLPPTSSLVTLTFNSSGSEYLDTVQSTLANKISTIFSISSTQIIILSVQIGYYDPLNTVDVSLAVREVGGDYRNITSIIHHLYVARQQLQFSDIVMYSIPLDPCLHEPCFNLGECQPITSIQSTATTRLASKWYILFTPRLTFSYQCYCPVGTNGDHCQENLNDCYSNPCEYGGICSDGLQDYTCQCPEGTSGKDCSINPDECLSNPCQNGATCINGFGKPVCECASGYYGDYCQYAYFHPSPHCDSNPCQHDSICSTGRDSFTCLCKTGFTGLTCQNTAQFQGGCVNNPCYNGSTCTDTSNGYICTCSIGFTGPNCRFPLNNCELELCRNGGTCERGLYGSFRCLCPPEYGGDHCTEPLSLCYSTPCHNGGTCIESEDKDSYSCECNREHYGDHCQYFVNPPDLCQDTPCNNNATCSSGQGNYTCTCIDGTGGHDCSEFLNNPTLCDSNPCLYGGVCSINNSMFICQCPIGFTGQNCEINANECTSNPCNNSGVCTDGFGSYICSCLDGFTGRNCDIKCPEGHIGERCETDLNYCTPSSCLNGGTCMELANNYTCLCPPQYTGKDCDIINDCTVNICNHGGTCVDSQSTGYQCQCGASYKGNHCELLTVSFSGDPALSSFRGYKTLSFRGQGTLNFEFATQSKDGLLLFNTQHQNDKSKDYIAVEIIDGYLTVKYSLGSDIPTNITVLSTSVRVSDGEWHNIEITITGKVSPIAPLHCIDVNLLYYKMLQVTLDYCIDLYEITAYTSTQLDCVTSVSAQTNYR